MPRYEVNGPISVAYGYDEALSNVFLKVYDKRLQHSGGASGPVNDVALNIGAKDGGGCYFDLHTGNQEGGIRVDGGTMAVYLERFGVSKEDIDKLPLPRSESAEQDAGQPRDGDEPKEQAEPRKKGRARERAEWAEQAAGEKKQWPPASLCYMKLKALGVEESELIREWQMLRDFCDTWTPSGIMVGPERRPFVWFDLSEDLPHPGDPSSWSNEASGYTAQHLAAQLDLPLVVEWMLLHGARFDPHESSVYGGTPLYLAAQHGSTRSAKVLLKYGARKSGFPSHWTTIADMARNAKHPDLAKLIDEFVEMQERIPRDVLDQFNELKRDFWKGGYHVLLTEPDTWTKLGDHSTLRRPSKHGDVYETALAHSAAAHGSHDLLRWLLSDSNGFSHLLDEIGCVRCFGTGTPLWHAAARGHAECVSILLEAGADPIAKHDDWFDSIDEDWHRYTTPAVEARKNGYTVVAAMIEDKVRKTIVGKQMRQPVCCCKVVDHA